MKKIIYIFIIILILTPSTIYANYDITLNRVVDNAELLTEYEEDILKSMIQDIIDNYNFDVVIVTTDTNEGKSVRDFADDYYDYNWYGFGEDYDGILFLLSMEERDWYISTHGYGITVFTDYGISRMGDIILSDLSEGNYYEAFTQFLYNVEDYIKVAIEGNPYDSYYSDYDYDYDYDYNYGYYTSTEDFGQTFLIILGVSALVSLFLVLIMKSKMNTVRFRQNAHDYIVNDSLIVLKQSDLFLYSKTSKTRRESNSSNGRSGGSSTHRSSSGRTHGGGGGKF